MQTTVDGLIEGKFPKNDCEIKRWLKKMRMQVVPNAAFDTLGKNVIGVLT